ncbi:MAG: integrin alpha [Acidobacteriota bacterium]
MIRRRRRQPMNPASRTLRRRLGVLFGLATLVALPGAVGADAAGAGAVQAEAAQEESQGHGAPSAKAPTASTVSFEEARALLRAREFDRAAEALRALAGATPQDDAVWRALGQAYAGAERWAEAVEAHLRSARSESLREAAWWDAARALARLERTQEMLLILERLAERGATDMTRIGTVPDFAPYRDHPRVRALWPTLEDLDRPFVEDVRVLHEWRGEAAGDSFGWIARRLGDQNGDGVFEVVTSAVGVRGQDGGAGAGRVYVFSGKDGSPLWTRDGEAGWRLGRGVESAGDVDGDGLDDVVASAPGGDRVFVFSGKSGATLRVIEASQPGESFGQHVTGAGDLDGDGHADLLVGAPQNRSRGQAAGRVAVYSGRDGALLWEVFGDRDGDRLGETGAAGAVGERQVLLAGAPGAGEAWLFDGLHAQPKSVFRAELSGSAFGGMFMSVVGDLDADGLEDLYISDWGDGVRGPQTGRIYLFSGADGRRLLTLAGEAAGDGFGIGIADAGDVNNDGHDDLAVGAWQHGGAAPGGGKVYVISGKNGAPLRHITSRAMGETFGFDTTHLGDVDGDGTVDLLVTSAWSPVGHGARTGRVFVIAGSSP